MLNLQRWVYFLYCAFGMAPSLTLLTIDVGVPYSIRLVHVCGVLLLGLMLVFSDTRCKLYEFVLSNRAFALLMILAIIIAPLAGYMYAGIPVMNPRLGIDSQIETKFTLRFGMAQLAHVVYLALEFLYVAGAFVLVGTNYKKNFGRVLLALGIVALGLAAWQLASNKFGFYYPNLLFYGNNRLEHIWETSNNRVMGSFSEPSLLAAFLVGYTGLLLGFSLEGKLGKPMFLLLLLATLGCLIATESMTGLAGLLLMGLLTSIAGFPLVERDRHFRQLLTLCGGLALLGLLVYIVYPEYFDVVLLEKVHSGSFLVRSYADIYSVSVLKNSHYLGVGLGVNATNSLLTYVTSSLGIVGLAIFLYMIFKPFFVVWNDAGFRRAFIKCLPLIAVVSIMSLSVPSLDFPPLWIILAWAYLESWTVDRHAM